MGKKKADRKTDVSLRLKRARDLFKRAQVKHQQKRFDEALDLYAMALAAQPEHVEARARLVAILEMAHTRAYDDRIAGLITECLATEGVNFEALSRCAAMQLRHKYRIPDYTPKRRVFRFSPSSLSHLTSDGLFMNFLTRTINRDYALEIFLTSVRRTVTTMIARGERSHVVRKLASGLARQAFNNEYIWDVSDEESALIDATTVQLEKLLPDPTIVHDEEDRLLLYTMYAPLWQLPQAEQLSRLDCTGWPDTLRPVAVASLHDHYAEHALAETIPLLSPIMHEVSRKVAGMYEENPYPRWVYLARREPIDIITEIMREFSQIAERAKRPGPLEVLMPGAGTGQHPLSVATGYRDCMVTAVDLSRNSLAYGKRMAQRLGIDNVAFLQGDILDLPILERQFDLIECVGVLHHMKDPTAGCRALALCLRPGGLIRIGLYGEHARRDIVRARTLIAKRGYPETIQGLRAFRRDVGRAEGPFAAVRDLMNWEDFYSASLVRDLVFHVQEIRFTIPKLRRMIEDVGITFIGFEFAAGFSRAQVTNHPALQLYRRHFPEDGALADLKKWEWLESMNPGLFPGYAFWCQKPPD